MCESESVYESVCVKESACVITSVLCQESLAHTALISIYQITFIVTSPQHKFLGE